MNNFRFHTFVYFLAFAICGSVFASINEDNAQLYKLESWTKAKKVVLHSIDPNPEFVSKHARKGSYVKDYKSLGSFVLEPSQRNEIHSALSAAIKSRGEAAMCFNPRHAVEVFSNSVKTTYLICFECGKMLVFSKKDEESIGIGLVGQTEFNKLLNLRGIWIAK